MAYERENILPTPADSLFSDWLLQKTWQQVIIFCKVIAVLIPVAALALDIPVIVNRRWETQSVYLWIMVWHVVAEAACVGFLLVNKFVPTWRAKEFTINIFCLVVIALSTWIGATSWIAVGDFSIYALGSVFVATVVCTPRHVRRPMYFLSIVGLLVFLHGHVDNIWTRMDVIINPICVAVICFQLDRFSYARNVELFSETQKAEFERMRADKVLYNVLPVSIADELKQHEKVRAVKFENMGILFADIAGFTEFSKALPPDAVVFVLNQIFSALDEIVEKYDLEKIKTIGDAYMVVSKNQNSKLADLALEFTESLHQYNISNGTALLMRIGLHVGPTVAGVIGVKRFLYDVWGDAVNIASRMETTSEPGKIHVSKTVHELLKADFEFRKLDDLAVKGMGLMETYYLLGRKTRIP